MTESPSRSSGILTTVRRWVVAAIGVILVTLTLLALVEGASSLILLASRTRVLPERRYTQYDPEIGWVGLPRQHHPDLYGPGKTLTTNAQGFRGSVDVTPEVPTGQRRVVCSGDSFTLGFGVADESTWCVKLGSPTVETVNMGQGGYGLDQVYLWYLRAGPAVHHTHIVAFITDDFTRMAHTSFLGYGKPRLALKDGRLITTNVPVPRTSFLIPWFTAQTQTFRRLRFLELVSFLSPPSRRQRDEGSLSNDQVWEIASYVFREFELINRRKGSRLILVYLPHRGDYMTTNAEWWRTKVARWARPRGVTFLDLVEAWQRIPPLDLPYMLIQDDVFGRHYTRRGHSWVANQIRPLLQD